MTLRERQSAFLEMIAQLIVDEIEPLVCLEWKRTIEQQQINVARGVSQTMKSKHLDGLAMDFCFLRDLQDDGKINWGHEKYLPMGLRWEALGGRWGGRFGEVPGKGNGWDCGHFEFNG